MNKQEIISYLGEDWTTMTDIIAGAVSSEINLLNTVNEDILSHSGKMLRPLIALLVARACGTPVGGSYRVAAATELLHNATLLHDDVADESAERRGVPTVNAQLGPRSAVLIGDFWLAKTMETMLDAEGLMTDVARFFSKTLVDLAEGEMLQLEKASSADTTYEDYFKIIYCKTASLFEAACASSAASVGASQACCDAVRRYARAAGIAFQIKDDIFDYVGDSGIGKPVGIDLRERKITLPLLCAIEGSEKEEEMRALVRTADTNPANCEEVHKFVIDRGGVEMAIGKLDAYISEAVRSLDVLPDSRAKAYLIDIAQYIGIRKK